MSYTLPQLAIIAIIACAVIGIAIVVIRQTGVQVPPWIIQVGWILIAAIVGILAIKILIGMF